METENIELKEKIKLRDTINRINGITYLEEDGTVICPVCTAKNPAIPVPMIQSALAGTWICKSCGFISADTSVKQDTYKEDDFDKQVQNFLSFNGR